jgi:hypothetical protein
VAISPEIIGVKEKEYSAAGLIADSRHLLRR